jgi:N-methylhydantoinase B
MTEEAALTLYQTTRSPLFNQGDFAVGYMDAAGEMLEQDEHLALMAFSLHPGCQAILRFFGQDIRPGDLFLHNDVWHGNLQHADTGFYRPIFVEDRLVAWIGCRGHWADIGGAVKGTANPAATEVWQEALRIPPLKVWDRGQLRRDVWEMVFANVRLREVVEADAHAQIGACLVGERRLLELLGRQSWSSFVEECRLLQDAGERLMRVQLAAIPNGRYVGESIVYDDEPRGVREARIRVTITVEDGSLRLDYTGTDPQQPSFMNAPYVSAASAALVTLLYLVDPCMPHNAGTLRPVEINIPEGCLLNARFPAATFGGNKLCEHNSEAIMMALAEALPERVTAAWARRLSYRVTGRDPRSGSEYHDVFFMTYGGGGGTFGADGYNQPGLMGGGNVLHQDYEVFELQNPLHLLEHEYEPDSAGPGRWRGGLGNRTLVRYQGVETIAVTHGDGVVRGARGVLGGGDGMPSSVTVRYPDGHVVRMHARERLEVPLGGVSLHYQGGGGGFGNPLERDINSVVADVRQGFVSPTAAERDYGVLVDTDRWTGQPTERRASWIRSRREEPSTGGTTSAP